MRYFLFAFFFITSIVGHGQNAGQPLTLVRDNLNHIDFQVSDSETYDLRTKGNDPYVFTTTLAKDLDDKTNRLAFEYFCPTGVDFIEVHFFPMENGVPPQMVRDVGATEGWVEFKVDISSALENWGSKGDYLRLDFGGAPDLNIQVRNLKLRPQTEREAELEVKAAERKAQEAILEDNLNTYLDASFEDEVSQVLVMNDRIKVTGKVADTKNRFVAEIRPYENGTELKTFEILEPVKTEDNQFEISVDRTRESDGFLEDRMLSKWVIVEKKGEKFTPVSHSRYADSIVPAHSYPFIEPATIKGLGGYSTDREAPYTDLDELGITSATVNILITKFFRSGPSPQTMPFTYLGETYYVDKEAIANHDKTFLSTAERDIEVSAILLVDKASKAADKEIGRILQHPDCDPAGIYAMPNLTTPEGVRYYAAALDFLAKRYTRPDKKYGRIHHWIIHNEVDAGWVWTNAGDKTALVFMDLYHKSMRMSYNIARSYHPEAKVFISLTHFWNWTNNPHFYHSKELLEQLLQFSRVEGDFEWAIAQHPYPESLREPKTWLDEKVSFDFDTKLITFKNTEVLNAWVQRPEAMYLGKKKRLVYLSENGTNSPTYSEQDLLEQAAGMAYALKKIKVLDGIDGFQYHNWQDNRMEGGLRIGLRRFPDDADDPGGIKPVWKVYQAFGTDKEDEVFDPYKKIIGIDEWDDIRREVHFD